MGVSKCPESEGGINFDLPFVSKNAPPCAGVEHVEGDVFQCVPRGEAILLKVSAKNTLIYSTSSDRHTQKGKKIYNLPNN
ncbi:unnamed protein product [Coffea canephora]|uniref:O-methyltransferase C-terminal domain-containing protein n=1 Tax=Coffea canephora TaxID=49390 RepID=A0A068UQN2_COFCA|nr:unnamed protein product [Coffea canephora]